MTNPFKSFLNSLKNISSTWPSVLSAAVRTHRKLNGVLACIERRETSWLLQQERGALSLQGLECQEVLGDVGRERWAWSFKLKPLGGSSTQAGSIRGREGSPRPSTEQQHRRAIRTKAQGPPLLSWFTHSQPQGEGPREVTVNGFLADFGKEGAKLRLQRMWYFLYLEGNGFLIPTQPQSGELAVVQWFHNRTFMIYNVKVGIFISKSVSPRIYNIYILIWPISCIIYTLCKYISCM